MNFPLTKDIELGISNVCEGPVSNAVMRRIRFDLQE